jgi:hypothetical protein
MNRVRALKLLLAAGALALTAALFGLSGPGRFEQDIPEPPRAGAAGQVSQTLAGGLREVASTVMTNPRFFGEDNNNRRWEVRADRAEQYQRDSGAVFRLVAVSAVVELGNASPLAFEAGSGTYLPDTKIVELADGVQVTGYDYVVTTQAVQYDFTTGIGRGSGGVSVSGPRGDVSARRFELAEAGKRLTLHERVKARLYPQGEVN